MRWQPDTASQDPPHVTRPHCYCRESTRKGGQSQHICINIFFLCLFFGLQWKMRGPLQLHNQEFQTLKHPLFLDKDGKRTIQLNMKLDGLKCNWNYFIFPKFCQRLINKFSLSPNMMPFLDYQTRCHWNYYSCHGNQTYLQRVWNGSLTMALKYLPCLFVQIYCEKPIIKENNELLMWPVNCSYETYITDHSGSRLLGSYWGLKKFATHFLTWKT